MGLIKNYKFKNLYGEGMQGIIQMCKVFDWILGVYHPDLAEYFVRIGGEKQFKYDSIEHIFVELNKKYSIHYSYNESMNNNAPSSFHFKILKSIRFSHLLSPPLLINLGSY